MNHNTRTYTLFLLRFLLMAASFTAVAQGDSSAVFARKLDAFRSREVQEKIFAHLDRSFYVTGETLWFSLYYVDGTFHRPLDVSKVAYVEVLDKDNKSVLQVKVPVSAGSGHGSLFIPASLSSGNYQVRAYTNWMKNFSPELYFQQAITVVNPFTKLGLTEAKEVARYDVQFFPEGGNLVAGIRSTVGFRAADIHGHGIEFHGTVVNGNNDTVAHFTPHKFGIGTFSFTPAAGQTYMAIVRDHRNAVSRYPLPAANPQGFVIQLSDTIGGKIRVAIRTTADTDPFCYLVTHTRETNIQARIVYLQNGKASLTMDKAVLAAGVSHFTVFNSAMLPVAERLYFKQPENMTLDLQSDASVYLPRRKVTLDLVAHAGEKPLAANVSVSVYKLDSLEQENGPDIRTWMWLTSELRGNIESPGYYLADHGEEGRTAVNNLMLTHGWSRFRWEDVMSNKPRVFEFIPEYRGHIITGAIKGLDPTSGKRVVAFLSNPDKNIRLYPSRSSAGGKVRFELREFYGSRKLIAQINTQVDSIYDVEIFSPFAKNFSNTRLPQFDFPATLANPIAHRSLYMQVQNTFHEQKNDMFAKPFVDTVAFYGHADERYLLDDYTRFPTMEEVLREYVAGVRVRKRKGHFHFVILDNLNKKLFKDNPLVMLDGVPVFDLDKIMALDPRKVRKLEVMTRRYYLGPLSFDGVVSYTTYHGDLSDFELDRRSLVVDYEGMQVYREFFSPQYDTDAKRDNRVPDARNLVYWKPALTTGADGKLKTDFYMPDIDGKYRVMIQALSADGKPGNATGVIEVNSKRSY